MAEKVIGLDSNGTLYDIEASSLNADNEYTVQKLTVKKTGDSAIIELNPSGSNGGMIEFNGNGNLSVESLSKHVNIESKKGIQLKPTSNITFDSGRRIRNGKGNEVHLQFVYDDYDPGDTGHYPGDDEEYAEVKVEGRNIDLRCFRHGGVAIQPCGKDGNDFENKIKFESSRTTALGVTPVQYADEGGKGLEFGTFNNEHTSLFTGDYRFNKDGMVYAVTRETPVTSGGKTDYPTQNDDFKDVVDVNLGVSWETLVKTAKVFEELSHIANPSSQDLMDCYNNVFNPTPSV